jgi:5-methyltetrahydropteroyltriglutamate--homocysteine methyltransferase
MELQVARWTGEPYDQRALDERLRDGVADIVRKQVDVGLDVVNDGEFSKTGFHSYVTERLAGIEIRPAGTDWLQGAGVRHSKDFRDFQAFYTEAADQTSYHEPGPETRGRTWIRQLEVACTGPVRYTGYELIQRDIANLTAALAGLQIEEAFLPVVAPGSVQPWISNEYYADDESFFADVADALRVEYAAIIDAGLICQIDDAFIPWEWDRRLLSDGWDLKKYRTWVELAIDALNSALDGLPEDRIRYHICWGSWNGPHSTDIPLKEIVDLVLKVRAQGYLIEAANARHEWEWRVWRDVGLPDGKILIPGVIEHTTNVVEHPETVAERITRFATVVGRENVIAGTDCGMRLRIHPQVAWAKLKALSDGARLASRRLWATVG